MRTALKKTRSNLPQTVYKKHLANYKVPKQFEVRPLLPLLASGKVDRRALVDEERASRQK